MSDNLFKGSKGGGSSFKQTPDNLRSTDIFEGVLAVGIGPMKGPKRGLKSIKLDGTAIENETGQLNFGDFSALIGSGDPAAFPQPIQLKLGAGAAPKQVGTSLRNVGGNNPIWATQTMSNTNADFIDLRFIVSQLFRQDKKGIYSATATLEIQLKPVGSTTWVNPSIGTPSGTYQQGGTNVAGVNGSTVKALIPQSYFNNDGTWKASTSNYKITGKTTSPAVYELRIGLPTEGKYANTAWDVRVRLLENESLEADPNFEKRTISWESLSAVYSDVLGTHEDWRGVTWMQLYGKASDQLTGVPEITGEWETKIVSVPPSSVFNPETRKYTTNIWDGSWTKAYTNDPAWILNDAISDSLSGISLIAPGSYLNKWDALEMSKWCSQLVPDGDGGMHPRYSLNLAVSEPQKAEEFVRYLAGAVGGLAWDQGNGEWRVKMDKPDTPVDIFTLETIDGEFVYSGTDIDTRFNDIVGQFKNAEMDYRQDAVRLFDNTSIAKIGRKPTTVALVGCTNRQEAMRRIKLRLRSTVNETRIVNFVTNRRGRNVSQLDMILIADGDMGEMDKRTNGRAVAVAADRKSIVLRDPVYLAPGVAYKLRFAAPNPDYNPETATQPVSIDWKKPTKVLSRTIINTSAQSGSTSTIYLSEALPANIADNLSVALEAANLPTIPKLYRVTSVAVQDDGERMAISAIEVDTGKWDAADNVSKEDTVFQDLRGAVPVPLPPVDGQLLSLIRVPVEQGAQVSLVANWIRPPSAFVSGFKPSYRINGGAWMTPVDRTQFTTFELVNPAPGRYEFRVQSIDRRGGLSEPLTAFMEVTQALIDATQIKYNSGESLEDMKPRDPGATYGAPEDTPIGGVRDPDGNIVGGTPANELVESHYSALDSIAANAFQQAVAVANVEVGRIRDRALLFMGPNGEDSFTLIRREATERRDSDQVFAETFDLLGAKSPNGQAFVLNADTVRLTELETFAQRFESINATFENNTGAIEQINQVLVGPDGGVGRAILTVDINGRIIGTALTNNGQEGSFIVSADNFRIEDPDTGKPYFYADDTGRVLMHDVEVDTLKIGAMDAEFLQNQEPFDGIQGSQTLPGGVIMKWGSYRAPLNDEVQISVVFNTPFPLGCDTFVPTPYISSFSSLRDLWLQVVGEPTRFGAAVATQAATNSEQRLDGFNWLAFGR